MCIKCDTMYIIIRKGEIKNGTNTNKCPYGREVKTRI